MRLSILHRTVYGYSAPVYYSIQQLRLTPRVEANQRIVRWTIDAPGTLTPGADAFGNIMHTLSLTEAHGAFVIEARGEVETRPLIDGRIDEVEGGVPPLALIPATPLTVADERISEFVARHLTRLDPHGLLDFAQQVCAAVEYQPGTTEVTSTASEALAQARGVCQDQAHVFIAGCRARGLPARYVSGYVHPGEGPHAASHAWADVYLGSSWTSIDVTHCRFASDYLCRLAVGRDYVSAAPVRGVRVGGGDEAMDVQVTIRPFPFADEGDSSQEPLKEMTQ